MYKHHSVKGYVYCKQDSDCLQLCIKILGHSMTTHKWVWGCLTFTKMPNTLFIAFEVRYFTLVVDRLTTVTVANRSDM